MAEREQKLVAALEQAVAEGIYDQLGSEDQGVRYDLWLMEDDSLEWRHSTWQVPENAVYRVFVEFNAEDLLGPYWSEGLERDDGGRPIVTEEQAREWAAGWAVNNAAELVYDTLDAAERSARDEAEQDAYWSEEKRRQAEEREREQAFWRKHHSSQF